MPAQPQYFYNYPINRSQRSFFPLLPPVLQFLIWLSEKGLRWKNRDRTNGTNRNHRCKILADSGLHRTSSWLRTVAINKPITLNSLPNV